MYILFTVDNAVNITYIHRIINLFTANNAVNGLTIRRMECNFAQNIISP